VIRLGEFRIYDKPTETQDTAIYNINKPMKGCQYILKVTFLLLLLLFHQYEGSFTILQVKKEIPLFSIFKIDELTFT
jgi:hypothetical protein